MNIGGQSPHETVAGIPDILYFLPEHNGVTNCLKEVPEAKMIELENSLDVNRDKNIYQEYFEYVIDTKGWFYPCNADEAFQMFQQLTHLPE